MNTEKKKIFISFLGPFIFVAVLWLVLLTEWLTGLEFVQWGLFPQRLDGLKGILFSPFIHADFKHLAANSLPLLALGSVLCYVYRDVAIKVVVLGWLMTGVWVWFFARDAFHIGASGLVYMLGSFLFFSGLLRREPRMMALSMLVVFLYGSMVWGVLPIKDGVSWESHLMGAVAGAVLAVFYRREGPQRKQYSWEIEPETEDDGGETAFYSIPETHDADLPEVDKNDELPQKTDVNNAVTIKYDFKPDDDKKK